MSWTVSVKVLGYLYFRPRVVTYMNQILGPVLLANCETCQVRQVNGMDITTRWTDNNCQNMNHHVLNLAFEWFPGVSGSFRVSVVQLFLLPISPVLHKTYHLSTYYIYYLDILLRF